MIKIKELKQLIIKGEIEFIEQVQHEDPKMYIDGIKDEINECDDINDIIKFYGNHGFELKTACKIIINLLMESAQLKENRLSNNNYGVFCIAAQLEQNNRELDVLWDQALKLYDEFRNSKFNNPEKSELECINEFLNKNKAMTEFEENHPEQLKLFLTKLNELVDEFHPNIYLLNDVFKGFQKIEIAILNELNKDEEYEAGMSEMDEGFDERHSSN